MCVCVCVRTAETEHIHKAEAEAQRHEFTAAQRTATPQHTEEALQGHREGHGEASRGRYRGGGERGDEYLAIFISVDYRGGIAWYN